mmetsp:Transcript_36530/g.85856  ORF Transcript_36530/g.85856 Transcript_36530/m.85856 type:complete len:95 (+) Transcript_36530:251-535(+)
MLFESPACNACFCFKDALGSGWSEGPIEYCRVLVSQLPQDSSACRSPNFSGMQNSCQGMFSANFLLVCSQPKDETSACNRRKTADIHKTKCSLR